MIIVSNCLYREAYYARKGEERKKEKDASKNAAEKSTEPSTDATSRILTKGAVMHFKGAELNTSREDIKVCVVRVVCASGGGCASGEGCVSGWLYEL